MMYEALGSEGAARDLSHASAVLEPGVRVSALVDEYRKLGRDVPPRLKNIGR